jgi:hypothetical protein
MTSLQPIRLAAIAYDRGFDIDCLLVTACKRLSRRGIRLGGLLQISTGAKGGCASTVHVIDLRTNTAFDIWEERGQCARGCRLDEGGLAAASRALEEAIADRVDLVIVNRFGRAESLGRGLLSSFSSAVAVGLPVLTAVRAPYDAAWTQFHGGFGCALAPEIEAILGWSERALPFLKAHLLESSQLAESSVRTAP